MPIAQLKEEEKASEVYEPLYGCSIPTEHQCPLCGMTWNPNHEGEDCPLLELEIEFLGANWFDEAFIN